MAPKTCGPRFVDALRSEANFYGLEQQLPVPRIKEYAGALEGQGLGVSVQVAVWQHKDDTSIYVDCLEQTIREDRSFVPSPVPTRLEQIAPKWIWIRKLNSLATLLTLYDLRC